MKRLLVRISVSVGLLLVSLDVLGNATMHGVVSAQDTGQPLAGVTVTIGSDCTPDGCRGFDRLISAADGSYAASDLHAGIAFVSAAYKPGEANYASSVGQSFDLADGAVDTFDIVLAPGVTIQGTVRRQSDGQPLANVTVALNTPDQLPYPDSGAFATTQSDAAGKYSFAQLHAAAYVVQTKIQGATSYQDQFYAGHTLMPPTQGQAADILDLAAGQRADSIDFTLAVGGRLLGTFIDQYSGLPIPNTKIDFQLLDTQAGICCIDFDRRGATTDAQGRFELGGLSDAPFYLSALAYTAFPGYSEGFYGCQRPCNTIGAATALIVPTGDTRSIEFPLYPNAAVSGTVTRRSDGAPVPSALVQAYVPGYLGLRSVYANAYSDAQGHYQLFGSIAGAVLVGTFDVATDPTAYVDQVYNDQDCGSGSCAGLGQYISVPGQSVSSIDFQLDAGASISGQVLAKDDLAGVGAWIYLYASDGTLSTKVYSGTDGTFRTAGLSPGTYYLAASSYSHLFACAFYGDVPCDCATSGVCVTPAHAPGDAQPIVLGAADRENVVIRVPANNIVFADGFE